MNIATMLLDKARKFDIVQEREFTERIDKLMEEVVSYCTPVAEVGGRSITISQFNELSLDALFSNRELNATGQKFVARLRDEGFSVFLAEWTLNLGWDESEEDEEY